MKEYSYKSVTDEVTNKSEDTSSEVTCVLVPAVIDAPGFCNLNGTKLTKISINFCRDGRVDH